MASSTPADMRRPTRIVAICSSAGGLASLERFFRHLPAGTDLAYVVVQHFARTSRTALAEILRDHTASTVMLASDGTEARRDHVYVAEPGRLLELVAGRFRSTPAAGAHASIDHFLRSLAADAGPRAVCAILSGAGSDGMHGARAIADAGGIVLVQDPTSAAYDSMPRAALRSMRADYMLPPEQMPGLLLSLELPRRRRGARRAAAPGAGEPIAAVLEAVRAQTQIDFTRYRLSTIRRRVNRRINILDLSGAEEYLSVLETDPHEARRLVTEMLIGVTGFFRDRAVWTAVRETVMPRLLARAEGQASLRLWVAGCSTGEEAYTLAMLLCEARRSSGASIQARIFATDIDDDALHAARRGAYPLDVQADIPRSFLDRYFVRTEGELQVAPELRDAVIFARHNLVQDPPFLRMDLVSCRNLLIYLDPGLQRRLVAVFHHAMGEGGTLILGPSESINKQTDLFSPLDLRSRLYSRRAGNGEEAAELHLTAANLANAPPSPALERAGNRRPRETPDRSHVGLLSAAEELQATNEELETMKEELLAVNEEVEAVNLELRGKVAALSRASSDLNNLLAGSTVAMVYLDSELRIQRFTPSIRRIMPLRQTDVGRPVTDITSQLADPALVPDCKEALASLVARECTIQAADGRWFFRRVRPYRSPVGAVEGALITFNDVTDLEQARSRVGYLTRVFEERTGAVVVTDAAGRVELVSADFSRRTGLMPSALVGQCISRVRVGGFPAAWFRSIRKAIQTGRPWSGQTRTAAGRVDGPARESLRLVPVSGPGGAVRGFLLVLEDATDEVGAERERRGMRCASALLEVWAASHRVGAAPQRTLASACRTLVRGGTCAGAWGVLLGAGTGRPTLPAARAGTWRQAPPGLGPPRGHSALRSGALAEAVARRTSVIVRPASTARDGRAARPRPAAAPLAVVPFVHRADVVAIMVLRATALDAFNGPELELLATFAERMAPSLRPAARAGDS